MAYNSLKRGLAILEHITHSDDGLNVTQISKLIACDMGSASRLLSNLQDLNFVSRKGQRGRFVLGNRVIAMGLSAVASLDIAEEARPFVKDLSNTCSLMAYFAVRVQNEVMPVVSHTPPSSFQFRNCLGSRYALHSSAAGKNYLAYTSPEELELLLEQINLQRYTSNTLTSVTKLGKELNLVRKQGYAVDNEETELGVKCMSSPIFDFQGEVAGTLGITGLASVLTPKRIRAVSTSVKALALQLSKRLGYTIDIMPTANRVDMQIPEVEAGKEAIG